MESRRDDFDLVLDAVTPAEAELAKELLESAGIPCMGQDVDLLDPVTVITSGITRQSVYVPKGRSEQARVILDGAWSKPALSEAELERAALMRESSAGSSE